MVYTNSNDYEKDRIEALKVLESQKGLFRVLEKVISNDGKPMKVTNLFYDLLKHSKFKDDVSNSIEKAKKPETNGVFPKFNTADDFYFYVQKIAENSNIPCIFSAIELSNDKAATKHFFYYTQDEQIINMLASMIKDLSETLKKDVPYIFNQIFIAYVAITLMEDFKND